jgi:hypothetical protein
LLKNFDGIWEKEGEYGREGMFNKKTIRDAVNYAIWAAKDKYDTSLFDIKTRLRAE